MTAQQLKLESRGVLRLSGSDCKTFLQGLITNDIHILDREQSVYAALLTPQGKFMFDMILISDGKDILLDIEESRKSALLQRLMMYKLRADVTIAEEDTSVWALWGAETAENGISYTDPRHPALKLRVISKEAPVATAEPLELALYHERRIRHGVPDGSRDMLVDKYFWLETNAEKLNGVSFTKGCYVGQELTARMKHKTVLKKSLMPMQVSDETKVGAEVETEQGKSAGVLHTSSNGYAIAFLRHERLNDQLFVAGTDIRVHPISKDDDEEE